MKSKVIKLFEKYTEVKVSQRKTREREHVDLRRIAISLVRDFEGLTCSEIGRLFRPNFNHATVIHSIKTHQNLLKSDPEYRYLTNEIKAAIGSMWNKDYKTEISEDIKRFVEHDREKRIELLKRFRLEIDLQIKELKEMGDG